MDLFQLNKAVQRLDIMKAVNQSFKSDKVQEEVIKVNQSQLFDKGELATGKKLSKYSEPYKKLRRKNGLRVDIKQHYFSGNMFNDMYAKASGYGLEIGSTASYTKYLEGGGDNFGVQKSNIERVKVAMLPTIQINFKKQLFK